MFHIFLRSKYFTEHFKRSHWPFLFLSESIISKASGHPSQGFGGAKETSARPPPQPRAPCEFSQTLTAPLRQTCLPPADRPFKKTSGCVAMHSCLTPGDSLPSASEQSPQWGRGPRAQLWLSPASFCCIPWPSVLQTLRLQRAPSGRPCPLPSPARLAGLPSAGVFPFVCRDSWEGNRVTAKCTFDEIRNCQPVFRSGCPIVHGHQQLAKVLAASVRGPGPWQPWPAVF